jgi:hypothetical protein
MPNFLCCIGLEVEVEVATGKNATQSSTFKDNKVKFGASNAVVNGD